MLFVDLITALGVAAFLTILAVILFRWRHPARNDLGLAVLFLFSIVFLTAWAGGVWLGAGTWVSFLLIGALVVLLVAALSPRRMPRGAPPRDTLAAADEGTVFGLLFWALVVALAAAVVVGYLA